VKEPLPYNPPAVILRSRATKDLEADLRDKSRSPARHGEGKEWGYGGSGG